MRSNKILHGVSLGIYIGGRLPWQIIYGDFDKNIPFRQ